MCKSALKSAALNVYINTKAMKDRERALEMNEEVDRILECYCRVADEIYNSVARRLR